MRKVLNGILVGFILLFLSGCVHYTYTLKNIKNEMFNEEQVDSICRVEKIPEIGEKWISIAFIEEESKKPIYQYSYIKRGGNWEKSYMCVDINDSISKFTIRYFEKIKK